MESNVTVKPLPDIFVPRAEINSRIDLFLQNKHLQLSNALSTNGNPRQETKSVWYSKAHVQTWLDEMEHLNASGLRVYFGEYTAADGVYSGQLCLFMVPTRQSGNVHIDIILEDEPDFPDREAATLSPRTKGVNIYDHIGKPKQYNFGSPCPPIC